MNCRPRANSRISCSGWCTYKCRLSINKTIVITDTYLHARSLCRKGFVGASEKSNGSFAPSTPFSLPTTEGAIHMLSPRTLWTAARRSWDSLGTRSWQPRGSWEDNRKWRTKSIPASLLRWISFGICCFVAQRRCYQPQEFIMCQKSDENLPDPR